MKKKLVVLMMVGMMALTFGVSTLHAAPAWWSVNVSEVGNSLGIPYMLASDAATPSTWGPIYLFFNTADAAALNQMVAASLTAFANSSLCKVYVDPALGSGSTIFSACAAK